MFDFIISLIVGFLLGYVLLKRVHGGIALLIVVLVGGLIGWQIMLLLPAAQTTLGYVLSTQMQLVWDTTHNIYDLTSVAKQALPILICFNALAALIGFWTARYLHKRKLVPQ